MRKLEKQEIIDLLYGCAVVGTGGGGDLALGLAAIEEDFRQGKELFLAKPEEVPAGSYVSVPYMCGSPASLDKCGKEYARLPVLGYPESLLAFRTLEEYFGKPFFGVVATELGGANTAYALHIACQLGLPIIDGDPAGRSVPELQHSSFYVEGIPMAPVAVATQFGDTMIIKDVVDDMRCEDMIRALAVASGNKIGVADHAVTGEQLRHSIIPHTLSYAMEIGRVLRLAREEGKNVAEKICEAVDGKVLFSGKVSKTFYEEEGAFILGEIHLSGTGDYKGESYGIWYKNENLVAYRNGKVDVSCPDLICVIDEEGNPVTNPHARAGQKLTIFALPAAAIWKTEDGVDVFGPRSFGFHFDYVPFS